LAFPTVHKTLEDFIDEYEQGQFTAAMFDIDHHSWKKLDI